MENLKKESQNPKTVYLLGICGTGMAALAGLLKEKGYQVTGSDAGCYPPMDQVLSNLNIPVLKGYDPENIKQVDPDLVIIGNVIRRDNPEARFAMEKGIDYMSFPEAMGEFFLSEKRPLVVTGTHGKTTTSTMLLSALEGCGEEPGFMIGGVPMAKNQGFGIGKSEWFVIEGDEYDSSFFQKVSKFLFYRPFGAIITSIEFDHADIFDSLEQIEESFSKFAALIPKDGVLVACRDWDTVKRVSQRAKCPVVTYGTTPGEGWRLEGLNILEDSMEFSAISPQGQTYHVNMGLPGLHNAMNALSVMALCHHLGLDMEGVIKGLSSCKGVKRRQEVRGSVDDILVIDDFAHHPRAVGETLKALKQRFPTRRLIAIFEPRTNTSRRSVFQKDYAAAFDSADKILVRQVPDPEKAPEGDRFSSEKLVEDLKARGKDAHFFENADAIVRYVAKNHSNGDVYVVLSNGPFEGIHEKLLDALRAARK
ncbi:MAG: UDP-N-acetylmuramate--L-alanine ligase [Thermodesulfobacteria bacterium]|nr:UDP-N-acetylmuramate--L-alanine ligase [Thermodesulfobacteriota bacterium]